MRRGDGLSTPVPRCRLLYRPEVTRPALPPVGQGSDGAGQPRCQRAGADLLLTQFHVGTLHAEHREPVSCGAALPLPLWGRCIPGRVAADARAPAPSPARGPPSHSWRCRRRDARGRKELIKPTCN